ncbi:hypothetical protein ACFUCQ_14640 [Streptomyces sp. NPDC057197]|uniref:DUF7144 family membrane protein n=1 Tax=unclassified Streptomyces TaxID=2593676 RepID=UPI00339FA1C6
MTAQPHSAPTGGGYGPPPDRRAAWAAGGAAFAGILLLLNGVLAILQGIAAIAKNDVYAQVGDYIYEFSLTGWGWLLVVLGAVAALAGCGILAGSAWSRAIGIVLASLGLVAQFLFLPHAPVWSVIMMAIDVFVIWALAVYEPDTAHG